MSQLTRRLAATVVIIGSMVALYDFCVEPFHCNRLKKAVAVSTSTAVNRIGSAEGGIAAQRNLELLKQCREVGGDLSLLMMTAANERVLGHNGEAIRLYREALRLDQRPEIYYNIAETEVTMGARDQAFDNLLRGSLFNPWMIREIDDGQLRAAVVQRMLQLRPENADFINAVNTLSSAP